MSDDDLSVDGCNGEQSLPHSLTDANWAVHADRLTTAVNKKDFDRSSGISNEGGSMNEDGEETVKASQEKKESYLPSWVLKMRQKIDDSRKMFDAVQSRIDGLTTQTQQLDIDLNKMMPVVDDLPIQLRKFYKLLRNGVPESTVNVKMKIEGVSDNDRQRVLKAAAARAGLPNESEDVEGSLPVQGRVLQLKDLPSDTLCMIYLFLTEKELFLLESVSNSMKNELKSSEVWMLKSILYFPCKCSWSTASECRAALFNNTYQLHYGLQFVKIMKREHGVTRRASIEPHRYLRQDRQISHPYPVFDILYETDSPMQIILSPSEHFTSDFRSYATRALELINNLTSLLNVDIHYQLVKEGIVSVLISMLNNEMASMQSSACSIIANLLCFESYTQCISSRLQGSSLANQTEGSSLVLKQLQLCSGHRLLLTLLTSPSASLNIIQGKQNSNSNSSSSNSSSTYGGSTTHENHRVSTSVQGVANQHSCRALNMIFCRDSPIPSKLCVLGSMKRCICCRRINSTSTCSSECNNSNSKSDNNINSSNNANETDGYMEFMGSHFTSSEAAFPWICRYYHKSGSVAEKIVTYIRISPDGFIQGRGQDSIGLFRLYGDVHKEIVGYVWNFHKTYVGEEVIGKGGYSNAEQWAMAVEEDDSSDSSRFHRVGAGSAHISHVGYWSPGVEIDDATKAGIAESQQKSLKRTRNGRINRLLNQLNRSNNQNVGNYNVFDGAVAVDVGGEGPLFESIYENNATALQGGGGGSNIDDLLDSEGSNWGDIEDESSSSTNIALEISAKSGLWGMCIYGVWETTSSTPHFNLEKGGVFQMIPVVII